MYHSCSIIILARKSQFSSLIAQCTIFINYLIHDYFLVDRKKDIELYCVKCDNISKSTILCKRNTCGVCKTCLAYQCKICKKRYIHRESVYNHLKNECINVEPKFKCSQCDYKAKRKAHLRSHVKLKHSIRKCDFCSYKSTSIWKLNKHIRLEHSSSCTCSQCGKKYTHLRHFKNHQKNLCGSELYFECNHCSYSTIFKSSMLRHIKGQHSEIFLARDSL